MKVLSAPLILGAVMALSILAGLAATDPGADGGPTFNSEIAPIIHQRCSSCHQPGQAAPFSLLSYEDVAKRGQLVRAVTQTRYMPPWHAEPGYGAFRGERRMEDAEIELLAAWIDAGMPEGAGEAPAPPASGTGWALGEPDMVVTMPEAFTVPADGPDIYRNFVVAVPTDEEKWIRAYEFRPEARSVVHHSLFRVDPSGTARRIDARDETPGFSGMGRVSIPAQRGIGGWAVGGRARVHPEDAPFVLPAGSDFIFATHFHPSGKEESERSSIALYFTDQPPTRTRLSIQLPPSFGAGAGILIEPGDADFEIGESFRLAAAVELYGATPHAHYVGKEFKAWAELPDGGEVPLLWIKDWDFAWQDMYVYKEPVALPKGATIHTRIRYDNSAANPRNPSSPPKQVRWGRGSEDEMGSVIFTALPVQEEDVAVLRKDLGELRRRHTMQAAQFLRSLRRTR